MSRTLFRWTGEHQVRSTGKRRYPVVVLVAHRPADSLRKPQDTREDRVYAATVCMRAGRYQKSMSEVMQYAAL